jgi:hypothetical protein
MLLARQAVFRVELTSAGNEFVEIRAPEFNANVVMREFEEQPRD